MKLFLVILTSVILLPACSVVGHEGVETASYNVIKSDPPFEVRRYDELVLVSTPMDGEKRNGAFNRLFKYISGENAGAQEIAMTAPVFMDPESKEGEKIEMTAPVFMDGEGQRKMSFVLPSKYTFETAPRPTGENVMLEKIENKTYAVIRFSGFFSESSIQNHKDKLEGWITENGYTATGTYKSAGYNAPWTLPMARRNEVLIPIQAE